MTPSDKSYRKKLIEVALPLDAINKASAREKSIRHGHPSTLHLWWARRPLAACRAVLFASLIDDPSEHPELFPTEQEQVQERKRLFDLIEMMVNWENSNNEERMAPVCAEILKATGGNPPPVYDPFAGGGSIPLEAQRLGLEAYASDLNPVAVLINKALIEIPPKFAGYSPVNPNAQNELMTHEWHGAQGLADDIRYYGKWMRDEAEKRIGHLYPKETFPKEYGGGEATVMAWLWARTITCPNPSCGASMPLISSFYLSKKKNRETWIEPQIDHYTKPPRISFTIKSGQGQPQQPSKVGRGAQFKCLSCNNIVNEAYVKHEGMEQRLGTQLIATVVEGPHGRVYLHPTVQQEFISTHITSTWKPDQEISKNPRWFSPPIYGMKTFGDLFTPRQLVVLTTFSDLVQEARAKVFADININLISDKPSFDHNRTSADIYADAIATYLGMNVSKLANRCASMCFWDCVGENIQQVFARQAIAMTWDFVESNPFSDSSGNFLGQLSYMTSVIEASPRTSQGTVIQQDSANLLNNSKFPLISTDPPYYDNIGYADLSDFFYVWLRRSLQTLYPNLFRTVLTPKVQELVATPQRFGGNKKEAQEFFEKGLKQAFEHMREIHSSSYPMTVYYAFKQAEAEDNNDQTKVVASTGWETMLEGLISSGFTVTGTWPIRTELVTNLKKNISALASSIVIVCRPRPANAPVASRRQFLNELRSELPNALVNLQRGSIAPVDLAQASIGPGIAIYSRYSKVVESDGTPLRVRAALQLINRALDEVLAEQEGEYDAETRWAIAWFEEYAYEAGEYGRAETLSKAKNTGLQGLVNSGFLSSRAGKVRLLKRDELAEDWNPKQATRLTVWEVMQYMIYALDKRGDVGAGDILRTVGEKGEIARDLAYRLYTVCERKGWASEALAYNSLVTSWSEISRLTRREASDNNLWEATFLGQ